MSRDFSQFGEQALIERFFQERGRTKGRFLDIGAHDGVSCSNTLALAEKGWGGVLVEPSPLAFTKLISTYADRPDIEFVNAGIAVAPGLAPFFEGGGSFVGTFDEGHRDEWEGKQHVHYRRMWTNAVDFEDLFEVLPGPYHFVSIDTEGTNIPLLKDLLWGMEEECELICVERDEKDAKLLARLVEEYNLRVYAETAANTLLEVL